MTSIRSPRIVDFSTAHFWGPVANHALVELGADVVKIETPTGDGMRSKNLINGVGMRHLTLGAGTRSLTADRGSPEWPRIAAAAARWADAVIVVGSPAEAEQQGIDFQTLCKANPSLVYCSITGFGTDGPWKDLPAHGLNIDCTAGLVPLDWTGDQPEPSSSYRSVGGTLSGIYAALGVLAGLYRRDHDGGAQYVHVSCWGAAMSWQWRDFTTYANVGESWSDYKDIGPRYSIYATRDHRTLLLCPTDRESWERFCKVADLPEEWKNHGDWQANGADYGVNFPGEREAINERMLTKTLEEWTNILGDAHVPFVRVLDWREALDSEHARVNRVMTTTTFAGETIPITASPVTVRAAGEKDVPQDGLGKPPDIGEHNREVLLELGLPDLAEVL